MGSRLCYNRDTQLTANGRQTMEALNHAQKTLLNIKRMIPFFKNLSDDEIIGITYDVQFLRFGRLETVFEQGSEGTEIYFVAKGTVNIGVGKIQRVGNVEKFGAYSTIANLGPKNVFGELSFITGEPRTAKATAYAADTTLLCFSISEELSEENADVFAKIYKNFIEILSEKLRRVNDVLSGKRPPD